MATSSIAPTMQDPTLHYRLDPGEPGVRTAAPASQSAYLVISQEQRNQTRLTRDAIAHGKVVVSASSTYTPGIDGAFLSVRSGLTEVVYADRMGLPTSAPPANQTDEPSAPNAAAPADQETPNRSDELVRDRALLQAKAGRIARRLDALDAAAPGATAAPQAEAQQARLEAEQRAVERALRQVQLAQIQDALGMLAGAFPVNLAAAAGNLGVPAAMPVPQNSGAAAATESNPGERINFFA